MCMMMAGILGAGLSMMGSVAKYSQEKKQTDQYNQEAAQGRLDASVAAANKYSDMGRKYVYDARQLQQEGYNASVKGMQAVGATKASTGSAGFSLGSMTVNSILADEDNQTARAMANMKLKQQDLEDSLRSNETSAQAEAQGRINSLPFKQGPDALSLGINIASAGLGAAKGFIQ